MTEPRTAARGRQAGAAPRGFTLVEVVIVLVVMGAIAASVGMFLSGPIRGAVDLQVRAELTDIADGALRRASREIQLALPNSLRVTTSGGASYLEFVPVITSGRYRTEPENPATTSSGANNCPDTDADTEANEDVLDFSAADTCFRSVGAIANFASIVANQHFLVVYNLGEGIAGGNVYQGGAATSGNKSLITATAASVNSENRITFQSHQFAFASPGNRFQVVGGPTSIVCNPATGELRIVTGYALQAAQPTALAAGSLLASEITACTITYSAGAVERSGLVTMTLTLTRRGETVSLSHETHVGNVP
jgi:MSHA biogenesis protein MshO